MTQKQSWKTYLYFVPVAVLIITIFIYPLGYSILLSFFRHNLLKPGATKFIGLGNFIKLFHDELFANAYVSSGIYQFQYGVCQFHRAVSFYYFIYYGRTVVFTSCFKAGRINMNSKDMYLVHKGDTARTGGIAVLNFIFLVIVLFPFFWLITTSFKPDQYITSRTLYWLPPELTFSHYIKVFTFGNLGRIFLNSVIVSFSTVLLSFIVIIPAAYALAILRPRGKGFISKFILSLQMLPGILLVIPLYMIMQKLHLVDTYRSLIISYTTFTTPFCFLLLSSYYAGLPIELFESAYIDGCNSFQALLRIALPLTAPGLVTVGTYSFLNAWNDFLFSNTFTSSSASRTLTVEVVRLVGSWGTRWGDLTAGATVTVIPVILVFLFANKYIISGLTAGSVKG